MTTLDVERREGLAVQDANASQHDWLRRASPHTLICVNRHRGHGKGR
jgi:hypothetical protein